MTEGDEKYKLGELTADMAAVKRDIVDIKAGQKEIIHKIDAINAVSVEQWEKRNAHVDKRFADHSMRLGVLEQAWNDEQNSTFYKVRKGLENSIVRFLVGAGMAALVVALVWYAQKAQEYINYAKELQVKESKN